MTHTCTECLNTFNNKESMDEHIECKPKTQKKLVKFLYKLIKTTCSFLEWIANPWSGKDKQESTLRLFSKLDLLPELDGYVVCEGCFTTGHSRPSRKTISEFLETNLKDKGDVADLVVMNETTKTMIVFTSKNKNKLNINSLDIEKIQLAHKTHYKNTTLRLGICVRDKNELFNTLKKANKSSRDLKKIITDPTTIILDQHNLDRAFREFKRVYARGIPKILKPVLHIRFHQDLLTQKIIALLTEFPIVLCDAICRSGKSYIMANLIQVQRYRKILICSTKPTDTFDELSKFFKLYFPNYSVVILKGNTIPKKSKKVIYIASKQYLDSKLEDDELEWLSSIKFDATFFDEPHAGGSTKLATEVCKTYAKGHIVFFTATGSKPKHVYNINENAIVGWSMRDINLCKNPTNENIEKLIEIHGDIARRVIENYSKEELEETYNKFPLMILVKNSFLDERKQTIKDLDHGWSIGGVLQMDKNGKFLHSDHVKDFLFSVFGEYSSYKGMRTPLNSTLNKIENICRENDSKIATTDDPLIHLVFLDPSKITTLGKAIVNMMNKYNISPSYECISICGDDNGGSTGMEIINRELARAKNNGKKGIIVFTGRMLTEGATIPKCISVFMMNEDKSYDKYVQSSYRGMTEDDGKKIGIVVDFDNRRVFDYVVSLSRKSINEQDIKIGILKVLTEKLVYLDGNEWFHDHFKTEICSPEALAEYIYREWFEDPEINENIINNSLNIHINDRDRLFFNSEVDKSVKSTKLETKERIAESEQLANEVLGGDDRDVHSGIEITQKRNDVVETTVKDERDVFKDIFPSLVVYLCTLTLSDKNATFIGMLDLVIANKNKSSAILEQIKTSWGVSFDLKYIRQVCVNCIDSDLAETIYVLKNRFLYVRYFPKKLYKIVEKYFVPQRLELSNNGEVSTPPNIRSDMLDQLPEDFWRNKNIKIFDPCSGKGGFEIDIVDRLMNGLKYVIFDEERRYKHIVEKMLYFADINPMNVIICEWLLNPDEKYKLNSYIGDTLKIDTKLVWGIDTFDLVCTNPPYSTNPSLQNTTPLYDKFITKYIDNCSYMTMIVPSKWFSGGKGLDKFRKSMLSRKDIERITHFDNGKECFPTVEIKGGVNYFLKIPFETICNFNGTVVDLTKYDILLDPKYYKVVQKLEDRKKIDSIYMSSGHYKVRTNDAKLHDERKNDDIICYVSKLKSVDRKKYIAKKDCKILDQKWKVITAEASGGGRSGFGFMIVIKPEDVYTDSYVAFEVSNEEEGNSLISYLKCDLPNFLLASRKITQHINTDTVKWIPIVPFDRLWTNESVNEYFDIDESELMF